MAPLDSVELFEGNEGIVYSYPELTRVDVPDEKIFLFWDRIEEIGV